MFFKRKFKSSFLLIDDSSDCLTDVVCFQASRFSRWFVNFVMQLSCIPAVIMFCYRQDFITGISKTINRLVNLTPKVYRDCQPTSYSQGLSHALIVLHPGFSVNNIIGGLGFLPALKGRGFQPRRFY